MEVGRIGRAGRGAGRRGNRGSPEREGGKGEGKGCVWGGGLLVLPEDALMDAAIQYSLTTRSSKKKKKKEVQKGRMHAVRQLTALQGVIPPLSYLSTLKCCVNQTGCEGVLTAWYMIPIGF